MSIITPAQALYKPVKVTVRAPYTYNSSFNSKVLQVPILRAGGYLYSSAGKLPHTSRILVSSIKSEIAPQMVDESFAMKGGEGPHSYAKNSIIQRGLIEGSKRLIEESIAQSFDPRTHAADPTSPLCIADLGCSTGPNTFLAMQTIIDAIQLQFQSHGLASLTPDIQILFNDQISNDFNTLFKNLPPNRNYFAAGIPGSFCGRLFPKGSVHLVHSSAALCWLSKIPREITDKSSSAWNKGRIHYTDAPKEVADAFATQYKKELESFLRARAQELVGNGLMLLQFPVSNVILDSDIDPGKVFELLGSCLLDMTKEGRVSEDKLDSFNVPLIYSPVKSVKEILEETESFSIEKMEILHLKNMVSLPSVHVFVSWFRAALQEMIEKHFGDEIVDELFDRFSEKVKEFPDIMDTEKLKLAVLFVLLKREPKSKA